MAAASANSSAVSFDALTGYNYGRWSVLIRNFLIGEGLWDVIDREDIDEYSDNWKRRNAKALYAIQLACGPDYFKRISEINSARDAWMYLKKFASPDLKTIYIDTGQKQAGVAYGVRAELRDGQFEKDSFRRPQTELKTAKGSRSSDAHCRVLLD